MKLSSLEILRSPEDGSPLVLQEAIERNGEIESGYLTDGSNSRFPIANGVPLFAQDAGKDETFSFKWKLIGDSYGYTEPTRSNRQNWYLERFGFAAREELMAFLRKKNLVLDAGTGTGVDAAMFAEAGVTVFALDLCSEAAMAAYHHIGKLPNVHIIQADLNRLPFSKALFDFVSCDQVLHHTPNTRQSFDNLASYIRQDGHFALYVYNKKSPIREFTDDYLRSYTTRMSAEECYEFCKSVTLFGKALSDLKLTVDIPADIPLLGMESGREDVQRLFYWKVMKCFWNDDYDFTTNAGINFDWYHPKYASRHTQEEVHQWFEENNIKVEKLNSIQSGISVIGKRMANH